MSKGHSQENIMKCQHSINRKEKNKQSQNTANAKERMMIAVFNSLSFFQYLYFVSFWFSFRDPSV